MVGGHLLAEAKETSEDLNSERRVAPPLHQDIHNIAPFDGDGLNSDGLDGDVLNSDGVHGDGLDGDKLHGLSGDGEDDGADGCRDDGGDGGDGGDDGVDGCGDGGDDGGDGLQGLDELQRGDWIESFWRGNGLQHLIHWLREDGGGGGFCVAGVYE